MRTSVFGNTIIEFLDDDLGMVEGLQEAGDDIFAVIREDMDGIGKYDFEIMSNKTGESIVASEPIFDSVNEARQYLRPFVRDIQQD